MVALEAKGADPDLGGEIHATEGVQGGEACLASERRVREREYIWMRSDWSDRSSEWNHALA